MGENGAPAPGIVTTHDGFAVSFTREEQEAKVEALINSVDEDEARQIYKLCSQNQWNYETAKRILANTDWHADLKYFDYRPFDQRVTVFNNQVAVHLRKRASEHMLDSKNIGLVTTRQRSQAGGTWGNVFCADQFIESTYISNKTKEINYLFPLWLSASVGENRRRPNIDRQIGTRFGNAVNLIYDDGSPHDQQDNFGSDYRKQQPEQTSLLDSDWDGRGNLATTLGPRDLFDWIYAVLYSVGYRSRYAEFLKSPYPRLPLPRGYAIFKTLAPLGAQLVSLHLLNLDDAPILRSPDITFHGTGEARVEHGYPKYENGMVLINSNRWFEDVVPETWNFHIGGYQVCKKWLKDRAGKGGQNPSPGRILTEEDILNYRRTATALTETRRLMAEIDHVIEEHGGWPEAFVNSGTDK